MNKCKVVEIRLAAIDGVGGDKPQHIMSLAHRGTVPHRRLDFIYSNKNHLVQLKGHYN